MGANGSACEISTRPSRAISSAAPNELATAVTNEFGEFHVAAQSEEDDVELCLLIQGVGQIRVPIDRKEPPFPDQS